jgi:hypothetical protein
MLPFGPVRQSKRMAVALFVLSQPTMTSLVLVSA